eukprot:TRINITY_DN428_c0_g1_i10.p1 TRINITY_DN428_c0_g1~~TRINITY_DN428_c0_g1_i10.p1  ORF type:complete len:292 (+),score=47.50 TRINITY_DN428_c0_g1_i10:76-876(+)
MCIRDREFTPFNTRNSMKATSNNTTSKESQRKYSGTENRSELDKISRTSQHKRELKRCANRIAFELEFVSFITRDVSLELHLQRTKLMVSEELSEHMMFLLAKLCMLRLNRLLLALSGMENSFDLPLWREFTKTSQADAFAIVARREFETYNTFFTRVFDSVRADDWVFPEFKSVFDKDFTWNQDFLNLLRNAAHYIVQTAWLTAQYSDQRVIILLHHLAKFSSNIEPLLDKSDVGKLDFDRYREDLCLQDPSKLLLGIEQSLSSN